MFGYVAGLPAFLAYFVLGLVFYAVFALVYSALTPQKEMTLIRAGNMAAVTALKRGWAKGVAYLSRAVGLRLCVISDLIKAKTVLLKHVAGIHNVTL